MAQPYLYHGVIQHQEDAAITPAQHERPVTRIKDVGTPTQKNVINWIDLLAAVVATLSLAVAVAIIDSKHFDFAARMQTDKQIVALGFILGAMNICMMRVLSTFCSWSKFEALSWHWRVLFAFLKTLPLGLSVAYKQFIGGSTTIPWSVPGQTQFYGPTYPPGLQSPPGGHWEYGASIFGMANAVMANSTVPFLNAATDDNPIPSDLHVSPKTYGFNIALLSETSAVALDAPLPARVEELQQSLGTGANYAITLSANVRGTVSQLNATIGDAKYWAQTYKLSSDHVYSQPIGGEPLSTFHMAQQAYAGDDKPISWNGSWALMGFMPGTEGLPANTPNPALGIVDKWLTRMRRLDLARHNCTAIWHITRGSIELSWAKCAPDPLRWQFQYYQNIQSGLMDNLGRNMLESLVPFGTTRNQSHWLVPALAVAHAAGAQATVGSAGGYAGIQINGALWHYWNVSKSLHGSYNESYLSNEDMAMTVPTLRSEPLLYLILAITPFITLVAVLGTAVMFGTPISRDFGLVALLAGVDTLTLTRLSGSGFSGKTTEAVPIGIHVSNWNAVLAADERQTRGQKVGQVTYRVGAPKTTDRVTRKRVYW